MLPDEFIYQIDDRSLDNDAMALSIASIFHDSHRMIFYLTSVVDYLVPLTPRKLYVSLYWNEMLK